MIENEPYPWRTHLACALPALAIIAALWLTFGGVVMGSVCALVTWRLFRKKTPAFRSNIAPQSPIHTDANISESA